jgi:hypothetical protein
MTLLFFSASISRLSQACCSKGAPHKWRLNTGKLHCGSPLGIQLRIVDKDNNVLDLRALPPQVLLAVTCAGAGMGAGAEFSPAAKPSGLPAVRLRLPAGMTASGDWTLQVDGKDPSALTLPNAVLTGPHGTYTVRVTSAGSSSSVGGSLSSVDQDNDVEMAPAAEIKESKAPHLLDDTTEVALADPLQGVPWATTVFSFHACALLVRDWVPGFDLHFDSERPSVQRGSGHHR